jgi:hypothetical protein
VALKLLLARVKESRQIIQTTKATIKLMQIVDNYHHNVDNIDMNVVENDSVVSGMLHDELYRCNEALASIGKVLSGLPKGSLSVRKRILKDREYKYHYLKFREGNRVINQHVSEKKLKELQNKLAQRKKYEREMKVYERRISYLKKLLKEKG